MLASLLVGVDCRLIVVWLLIVLCLLSVVGCRTIYRVPVALLYIECRLSYCISSVCCRTVYRVSVVVLYIECRLSYCTYIECLLSYCTYIECQLSYCISSVCCRTVYRAPVVALYIECRRLPSKFWFNLIKTIIQVANIILQARSLDQPSRGQDKETQK
jgi:hypothetical protein